MNPETKEMLERINQKFDDIEQKIDQLLQKCYLCGNHNPNCELTDCPHK